MSVTSRQRGCTKTPRSTNTDTLKPKRAEDREQLLCAVIVGCFRQLQRNGKPVEWMDQGKIFKRWLGIERLWSDS